MKRRIFLPVMVFLLTLVFCAAARGAELKDPKEIMKKSWTKINGLKSYSYNIVAEGWETNVADMQKRTQSVAGEATDKFGGMAKDGAKEVTTDSTKPKWMTYSVDYKFMKPYLVQMNLTKSDYVPKIMYGSLLTYRPDKDPNIFWFKPRFSPMAIKRDIKSESGNYLYSTMFMQFIQMEQLGQDTKPVLKKSEKVGEKDAYVVAFEFAAGKKPKRHPIDFKKWGVPKEVQYALDREAGYFVEHNPSKVQYFFDKASLWLVAMEHYDLQGKKLYRKEWRKIKENALTEKDF